MTSAGIDWQREKWQSGLGSKFIHQGEKNAAKYADEVIVLSKGVQDYFKETYGRETHFIPNGVNGPFGFCYNGQFRRGADGTPLTYMLHGHIHKSEDQVLVDRFGTETRATMRKSAHQETAQPVPCQMINCFCMYSDYTPLTLEEWVECDQRRRNKADCG